MGPSWALVALCSEERTPLPRLVLHMEKIQTSAVLIKNPNTPRVQCVGKWIRAQVLQKKHLKMFCPGILAPPETVWKRRRSFTAGLLSSFTQDVVGQRISRIILFPSKNPFRRATHAGTKHRIRLRTEILGIGVCGLGKV